MNTYESPIPSTFTPTTTTVTAVSTLSPSVTTLPAVANNTYCQTIDHIIPPLPATNNVTCGIDAYFRNATNIMRGCCGDAPVVIDDSGCALYCTVTGDGGDLSDCLAKGTGRSICVGSNGSPFGIFWNGYTPSAYTTSVTSTSAAATMSGTNTPQSAASRGINSLSKGFAAMVLFAVVGNLIAAW